MNGRTPSPRLTWATAAPHTSLTSLTLNVNPLDTDVPPLLVTPESAQQAAATFMASPIGARASPSTCCAAALNTQQDIVFDAADASSSTTVHRLKQMMHTHQGRDKVLKVWQYALRLFLHFGGARDNASRAAAAANLGLIMNTRRMFKVGRFVGEYYRAKSSMLRCAELSFASGNLSPTNLVGLQVQMLLDITARLICIYKSMIDDLCWAARKNFLHSSIDEKFSGLSMRAAVPIVAVDWLLNAVRLFQAASPYFGDASQGTSTGSSSASDSPVETPAEATISASISLLDTYEQVDRLRGVKARAAPSLPLPRTTSAAALAQEAPASPHRRTSDAHPRFDDQTAGVTPRMLLALQDPGLHWAALTQLRLSFELALVVWSVTGRSQSLQVILCGLSSAVISVYRVWVFGR